MLILDVKDMLVANDAYICVAVYLLLSMHIAN